MGELWKQNTTFWDAIGHFWWALGTTQVSFRWTIKNTSCWPEDFNDTLVSLTVENIHLKDNNVKLQSLFNGCDGDCQSCQEELGGCMSTMDEEVEAKTQ